MWDLRNAHTLVGGYATCEAQGIMGNKCIQQ